MSVNPTPTVSPGSGVASIAFPYAAVFTSNPGGNNDMLVLLVGYGNSAGTAPATPAGWTSLGSKYGGSGSWGSNTGSRGIVGFYKVSDGTETGTVTVTNGGSGTDRIMRGVMFRTRAVSATTWATPAMVSDDDTSLDATFNVTPGSNPGGSTGDLILAAVCWAQSTINLSGGAGSTVAWPGAIGAGATTQQNTGTGGGGNNLRFNTYSAVVGGTATGNITQTLSLTGSAAGVGMMVRLRATGTAPVADLGANVTGAEPFTELIIDGTNSSGSIASASLLQTAGSDVLAGLVTLGTLKWKIPELPATVAGETLTLTLQVTDPDGLVSNVDTKTVEILPPTEFGTKAGVVCPVRVLAD